MRITSARTYLTAILLALAATAGGQVDTVWVRRLAGSGNGDDRVRAVAADQQGNVFAAASSEPGDSSMAITTAKYSPDGVLLWTRRFTGYGYEEPVDVAVDPAGNVVVLGWSYHDYEEDIVVLKYEPDGDSCWVRYYAEGVWADIPSDLLVDDTGNVYVVGACESEQDYEDILLVKYSPAGVRLWDRTYDYQRNEDFGIAGVLDPGGYVYVVGTGVNNNEGDFDIQALKYGRDGSLAWARTFRGPDECEDSAVAAAVDPQGNLVLAACTFRSDDSSGHIVVKYSPAGDTLWSRRRVARRDANAPVAVAADQSGNVVVAGNEGDMYLVVKYSPAGSLLWERSYAGPEEDDSLAAMVLDESGNIFVTGLSWRRLGPDVATVKYSSSGEELWAQRWTPPDSLRAYGWAACRAGSDISIGGYYQFRTRYRWYDNGVLFRYGPAGDRRWYQSLSTPGRSDSRANDVAFDQDGNAVVAGYLDAANEANGFLVAKYSAAGDSLWARAYHHLPHMDDEALRVATDQDGNVYATGTCETDTCGLDYLTVKYDCWGGLAWANRYNGPGNGDDIPTGLAVDRSGNVLVTGKSMGDGTQLDYATVKYSPAGAELWVRRYGGTASYDDVPCAVLLDSTGRACVVGYSREEERDVSLSATIIMYDPEGEVSWITHCANPDTLGRYFYAYAACMGPTGDIYVGGPGYRALLAARLDPEGDTLWVRRMAFDSGGNFSAGAVDSTGRFYASGYTYCNDWSNYLTAAFGPNGDSLWLRLYEGSSGTHDDAKDNTTLGTELFVTGTCYNRTGGADATTIAYDSLGNVVWMDTFDCQGSSEAGQAVASGPGARLAVAGSGEVDDTDDAILVIVYAPRVGLVGWAPLAAPEGRQTIVARPSLFRDQVRLEVRGRCDTPQHLQVFDRAGRLVRTLELQTGASATGRSVSWDGRDDEGVPVADGVYLVRVPETGGWRAGDDICKVIKAR
ncbi:SBBP repeat-containing protein [candidate division WOR-3 bacterium]|nr:SBBP repeat-containing protein [candidate division WOR-3 bacterium]